MLARILLCPMVLLLLISCKETVEKPSAVEQPATLKPDTGYASVNGLQMYYEIHGKGNPLVLIHGGGSTIQNNFGAILPALSKNRQVIAVELQAHGHTSDRNTPESFEQDADDVVALLQSLKIDSADFLGFSNGGNTVMQIAMRHPQQAKKLIIASAFYKRSGMMQGFFEGLEKATLNDMPKNLRDDLLAIKKDSAALRAMFEKDRARMVGFKDWREEDLNKIKAASLIILGDKDVMTTEHGVAMSRQIRNSQLMILPAYHGSYLGQSNEGVGMNKITELTLSVIEEFLGK